MNGSSINSENSETENYFLINWRINSLKKQEKKDREWNKIKRF